MKNLTRYLSPAFLLFPFLAAPSQYLSKTADAVGTFYTNVGQIGLTITNYGTLGTRNSSWPTQPSCVYPTGSLIEHMYQSGLWVGARLRHDSLLNARVSTGSSDRASVGTGSGFEFTTEVGSTMIERSTLSSSRAYDEHNSISHQDFVADYTDRYTRVPVASGIGDSIPNHNPLKISIHQESYAWNFPYANNFVIINYTIKNVNTDTLDDVYVGLWSDNGVRNTNYVRPSVGAQVFYQYCLDGYDSLARMAYSFEGNQSPGNFPANSYIGIALLGTTPYPANVSNINNLHSQTFYNIWQYSQNSTAIPELYSPTDDYSASQYYSRYTRLSQSVPQAIIDRARTVTGNYTTMLSTGPWRSILPGDSIEVVLAVICAKNANTSKHESVDDSTQRAFLKASLSWAQRCYSGEDVNGNDTLDAGEDIISRVRGTLVPSPDGKLTRYVLPMPPLQPQVHAEVENQKAVIYWDRSAEFSRDPISGKYDFEGYRVYRTKAGSDFKDNANWVFNIPMVGDFDRTDDTIGYNTGFWKVIIDSLRPPVNSQVVHDASGRFAGVKFPGDTTTYYYQFPGDTTTYWYQLPGDTTKHYYHKAGAGLTQLNGWQYVYGVSAYDQGDLANNLDPLESAKTFVWTVSGTKATSDPDVPIGVYPNPYYARAYWDGGTSERNRKIYFTSLPANATITIYTLAGDVVAQMDHSVLNAGTNIHWFQQYSGKQAIQFTGGQHAWDLISKYDQAIASGLYLFTVKDKDTGAVKRGKFLVIK